VFERNAYDIVHSRFVAQGIKTSRWAPYVQDIKRLLRPNGWLQMMEYYPNIQSDNGRLTSQSALSRWWETYASAMERSNRNARIGHRLQQLMSEAGLRDVGGSIFHLPIGGWDPGSCLIPIFHTLAAADYVSSRDAMGARSLWCGLQLNEVLVGQR
jgi:hypothetical protein